MNIYERAGRLAEQIDNEQSNHRKTIDLLRGVVEGRVELSRVKMTGDGWVLAAVDQVPSDEPKETLKKGYNNGSN